MNNKEVESGDTDNEVKVGDRVREGEEEKCARGRKGVEVNEESYSVCTYTAFLSNPHVHLRHPLPTIHLP